MRKVSALLGLFLLIAPATMAAYQNPPAVALDATDDPRGSQLQDAVEAVEALDVPLLVDEDGDNMTGDLVFEPGAGVVFPGGRLTAEPVLDFAGDAVCLAGVVLPGCGFGDITAVGAGFGLLGGGDQGDVSLEVDPVAVQRRVSDVCAAGSSIRSVAEDGSVACEADDDSGGDITGVSAGVGLSGGGLIGDVSLRVALGGITSELLADGAVQGQHIADGAVTDVHIAANSITTVHIAPGTIDETDIDLSGVQQRVAGSCAAGSSIRVVNSDGTVDCEQDTDTDTTYSAGSGLDLTGTTFSVDTSTIQSRVTGSCAAGTSIRAIDGTGGVACEPDDDSGGDITAVSAGSGLSGGGTAGAVSLSVDTAVIQNRVSGSCASGASIRVINGDGTVACEADDGTTYGAGSGLLLTGTTFSVDTTSIQSRVTGTCAAGTSIRAIDGTGGVACEPDDDSGGDITAVSAGSGLSGGGTAGDVSLSVNTAVVQNRVAGSCAAGNSIRVINSDGTVTCEADDVGSGVPASGLVLSESKPNAALEAGGFAYTGAVLRRETEDITNKGFATGIPSNNPTWAGVAYAQGFHFVFGGLSGGVAQSAYHRFDPATGTWTNLGAHPVGAWYGMCAISTGKTIYLLGGKDVAGNYVDRFWRGVVSTTGTIAWTNVKSASGLTLTRTHGSCGDVQYDEGAGQQVAYLAAAYRMAYFFPSDTAATITVFNILDQSPLRWGALVKVVGNKLYSVGGSTNSDELSSPVNTVQEWTITGAGSLTESSCGGACTPLPQAMFLHGGFDWAGRIYVGGGTNSGGTLVPGTLEYNPLKDTWTTVSTQGWGQANVKTSMSSNVGLARPPQLVTPHIDTPAIVGRAPGVYIGYVPPLFYYVYEKT